jgi:hypothetical protein
MKPENNSANKAIFLSQYWNQEVLYVPNLVYTGNPSEPSHEEWIEVKVDEFYIMKVANSKLPAFLTPLSQITDEDAIEVANIAGNSSYTDDRKSFNGRLLVQEYLRNVTNIYGEDWINIFDYLRSKGYALPWMGLSVDELVEYGWIKLK